MKKSINSKEGRENAKPAKGCLILLFLCGLYTCIMFLQLMGPAGKRSPGTAPGLFRISGIVFLLQCKCNWDHVPDHNGFVFVIPRGFEIG